MRQETALLGTTKETINCQTSSCVVSHEPLVYLSSTATFGLAFPGIEELGRFCPSNTGSGNIEYFALASEHFGADLQKESLIGVEDVAQMHANREVGQK